MARLEAQSAMLYYPTPLSVGQRVVNHLVLPESGMTRLFDPCCGEGAILASMAKTIKLAYPDRVVDTWGIELSPERAAAAARVLDNVREMPFEVAGFAPMSVRRRFSLCLFNPPYDTVDGKRLEQTFWRKLSTWTGVGSVVVAVLSYRGLTHSMMEDIIGNYKTLAVWRFGDTGTPGERFETFKQIVLVLERETSEASYKSYVDYAEVSRKMRQYGASASEYAIRQLPTEPPADLVIKLTRAYGGGRIIRRSFTEGERQAALNDTTLHEQMTAKLFPVSVQMERPLMPLRVGHIAMVVAGGQAGTMAMDGEVFKGRAVKTQVETTDPDDPTTTYLTDKYDTHITEVTRKGLRHLTLAPEIEAFLNDKADTFKEHIETEFVPYGNDITDAEHAILDTLSHDKQLPGCKVSGLLPQQKTFAVALTRAVAKYGVGHIVGEMGTGKTRIALSSARLMNSYPLLVTCPPHLVEDWVEEFEAAIPGGVGVIVETLTELEAVIKDYEMGHHPKPQPVHSADDALKNLQYYSEGDKGNGDRLMVVISHSRIKLGPGWVPSVATRYVLSRKMVREIAKDRDGAGRNVFERSKLAREEYRDNPSEAAHEAWVEARKELKAVAIADPVCPECGERLYGRHGYKSPVWKNRSVYCFNKGRAWDADEGTWDATGKRCGSALWQSYPKIAKRWPLADYIHDHHNSFFKLLIVDEVHKTKSKGTGIATSAHQLMTCMPVITCTGTFFGGNADSIFFILYRTQSMVRQDFGFNDEMRWTERFGVIQRKFKTSETTSANTGRTKRQVGISPKPGLSPEAIRYLLPTTVFARLADYGIGLPDYNEEMVPIDTGFMKAKLLDFENWAFDQMIDDWPHWTSSWLQWALGRPNSAFRREVVHYNSMFNYDNTPVEDGEDAIRVLPSWISAEHPLLPKEEWLVAKVKAELAERRRVIIYPRQTGTRDIRPRLVQILEAAGVHSIKVLDSKVPARTRKQWLAKNKARVLITNPRLVETGMNLHEFGYCTIVFYEIEYSLYTLWQAMCRVWRLGQLKKVRVFFTVYEKTQEEKALALIGLKMKHGQLLYGDQVTSALVDSDGDTSLVQDLIRAIKDSQDLAVAETNIFGSHRGTVVSVAPIGSPIVESKVIISLAEWAKKTHGKSLAELRSKRKPRKTKKVAKMVAAGQGSLF